MVYEYEQGGWNEWHIVFSDGASGWLSDAQLAIRGLVSRAPTQPLPAARPDLARQASRRSTTRDFEVATLTLAMYKGVEGELPFPYYGKSDMLFADLRTPAGRFGTLDYSEEPPLLFLGEWVEFEELQLKNLRQFEGWS